MAAEGHLTLEELGAKLGELEETRKTAERELGELKERRMRIEELERDKTGLLEEFADMVPEALAELTGEERHQIYRTLRLEVFVYPDGNLEIRGAIGNDFCTPDATSSGNLTATGC